MFNRRSLLFLVFLMVASIGWTANWETLPPDHWAYQEIRWLQAAGYLLDLDPAQRPYTRGQIASALERHSTPATESALQRLNLLAEEFKAEMTSAGQRGWRFTVGGRIQSGITGVKGRDNRFSGFGVGNIGVGNRRMGAFTALRFDRDIAENPDYTGKIWHQTAGFTEQAYFILTGYKQRWSLKLGRDHLSWGPGEDHLILNDSPRGLDQISFKIRWKWGNFTTLIAQLDDFTHSTGTRTPRFLTGHRLEVVPWCWLTVGVSETILYPGGVRFGMMNPLLPFYGELVNENSDGNSMISLDANAWLHPGLQAYGEILLDDIQLEKKKPQDLEPTEWGWLIGTRSIFFHDQIGLQLDYSGVTNRTYNAVDPTNRYMTRGLPLGSELGNDGDLLKLQVSGWPIACLRLDGYGSIRRQGEGRVNAPFDTSYVNYSVNQGYNEPFPSGTVEKTSALGFGFWGLINSYFQMEGVIEYDWIKNAGNIPAYDDKGARGKLILAIHLDHLYQYP
jgi:hypothetical protein